MVFNITNAKITGDVHGNEFARFHPIQTQVPSFEHWAVIILGDAGFNYFLNEKDQKAKDYVSYHFPSLVFYCVRGNHEQRPELLPNMKEEFDPYVQGFVYYEEEYPNIKYFKDGGEYNINGKQVLVIGGAYSIDKDYRLLNGWQWFSEEQLNERERAAIAKKAQGKKYDAVFSHTCPVSWEPVDLFLPFVNQSKVDKSMEIWMDQIKDTFTWDKWFWGHYHSDRYSGDKIMMYKEVQNFLDFFK